MNIQKQIDSLLTLKQDTQKHINGALVWSWVILVSFAFGKLTGGIIAIIVGLLLSVGWELYGMKKGKPFSFEDILVFVVSIIPISALILGML